MDYIYFGGIYCDCWLIVYCLVFIIDFNFENEMVGGGFFVVYDKVFDIFVEIILKVYICNDSKKNFKGVVEYEF